MKKVCLICGRTDESDSPTCPDDGEASWQTVEEAAPAEPVDTDAPKKTKKGAK